MPKETDPLHSLIVSQTKLFKAGDVGKWRSKRFGSSKVGKYGIRMGKIIINVRFLTKKDAKLWGTWNYTNGVNWQVVKFIPVDA